MWLLSIYKNWKLCSLLSTRETNSINWIIVKQTDLATLIHWNYINTQSGFSWAECKIYIIMFLLLSFLLMTDDDILTVNSCSSYVLSCNFGHFKNVTWTETEICHLMSEYIHMLHYITCLLIHIVLTSNIKSSHSLYYVYCTNNIASHSSSTRLTLGSIPLPSDRGEI